MLLEKWCQWTCQTDRVPTNRPCVKSTVSATVLSSPSEPSCSPFTLIGCRLQVASLQVHLQPVVRVLPVVLVLFSDYSNSGRALVNSVLLSWDNETTAYSPYTWKSLLLDIKNKIPGNKCTLGGKRSILRKPYNTGERHKDDKADGEMYRVLELEESILWKWLLLPKGNYGFSDIPIKLLMAFFTELLPDSFTVCRETQKTPNSQSKSEKEKESWRNQAPWLQAILQSYSNWYSMVLTQKQNYRSVD